MRGAGGGSGAALRGQRSVGELSRSAAGLCMQHMQESLPECPQREQFQTVLSPYNTKEGWGFLGGFPSRLRWTANFCWMKGL